MYTDKKNPEVNASPSASESGVGIVEEVPKKTSFGKKLLYHLWDADKHLKSEHVRLYSTL
jgi:ACS family pantothenate transporter-like MFS transporter